MSSTPFMGRRIAFLHHQLALGGSERVSYDMASFCRGLGIESYFFAMSCDQGRWLSAGSEVFPVILLPEAGKNTCFTSPNVEVLIRELNDKGIEFLFVAVPDKVLPTKLKAACPQCRVVYWLHSVPFFEGVTKIESYRTQGERRWYSRIAWHLWHRPRLLWGNRLLRQWHERYRAKLQAYDAFVVLCEGYKRELVETLSLPEVEQQRIFVKTNRTHGSSELIPEQTKAKQIVYMGRLSRSDKRIDRLLRIWAKVVDKLPEWELLIYGSGDKEERYLRRLAEGLGLVRCRFMGFAPEPREVYRRAAVLCMTSSYEGWGLVLSEAQAEGAVPVAFDVSEGIRHILFGDKDLLIKPFDLDAYAEMLFRLCQDEAFRERKQAEGLDRSRQLADTSLHEREYLSILNILLR